MDISVAIVQAYLRINGYFTVSEYPVIEAMRRGQFQAATDLDILAVRFPEAGRVIISGGQKSFHNLKFEPDPILAAPADRIDMLIGEVKEGRAELNRAARNPDVLDAVLRRFGCCTAHEVRPVIEQLLSAGHAVTSSGHSLRLIAFGSTAPDVPNAHYTTIKLGHVIEFIRSHFRKHWDVLRHAQFKDDVMGFIMALEKSARAFDDNS